MEPAPENVTGEVVQRHSFDHSVNWGHVILGVAALYVAHRGFRLVDGQDAGSQPDSGDDW